MERTHKTWGDRVRVHRNDLAEVSYLDLMPNQRCSWHTHKTKFNQFFVVEGEIFIKTDWGLSSVTKGQVFTTRPGEWHEFQTGNFPAKVIEVMYVQYDEADIIRKDLGGPLTDVSCVTSKGLPPGTFYKVDKI